MKKLTLLGIIGGAALLAATLSADAQVYGYRYPAYSYGYPAYSYGSYGYGYPAHSYGGSFRSILRNPFVRTQRRQAAEKPITGIAACCARAATGHAVTLPSSVMNSRRRIIRSPRRHVRAEAAEC
jgi:hypothetical protein